MGHIASPLLMANRQLAHCKTPKDVSPDKRFAGRGDFRNSEGTECVAWDLRHKNQSTVMLHSLF